jgi:hypothetical protein
MSKKYFAKWLPEKGEIKQFDKVIIDGKIDVVEQYPFTDPYGDGYDIVLAEAGTQMAKNCNKVKLSLCSRDIQVGDRIYYDGMYWDNASKSMIESAPFETVKVIGEISPDATWVKEGDEFDEEDWELWIHALRLEKTRLNTVSPIHVKVKGPCGRFH